MNNPLSQRLQDWTTQVEADPAFSARVQARLAAAGSGSTPLAFRWAAAAGILGALAIGVGGGLRTGQVETNQQLAANYARSIDPLQLAETHSAHNHSNP